jgi:hypothetical protein
MTLGEFGSTLNDELNRLANGGTYRDKDDMVDEALAAKQWANRENINPYSTDTVGILNEIAGLGTNRQNWLDFNGVCNYIAGTTGLPAAAALRQVYNTTDLLTSQSAYYVDATDASASGQTITNLGNAGSLLPTTLGSSTAADSNDPKFLDWTGTNYVYTPGVSGNNLTSPDTEVLDITGDIDVRAYVALDDWTPAASNFIISKWGNGSQKSYALSVNATSGVLTFFWTADGSTVLSSSSTVAPTIADGAPLWIRATLDVNNGASGNDTIFYTSTNGTTWTQLGSTVTKAGTTSIFSGTETLRIGNAGIGGDFLAGKFYRAQVLNGIDGTKVLDVDTSVITAGSATSFTAVTGQTVTINRSTSGRKTVAVTQPTWLFGTDDYMEVNNRYMASGTYLYLPGVASNYASTPDAAAVDIIGDIDIRVKAAFDDWTPSATQILLGKYASGTQYSYAFSVASNGRLQLGWSPLGTTASGITVSSTVSPTVVDGETIWVRATLDVDNGASGNDVKFFTSPDGTTWTQLGSTVTTAGTTSIFNSTAVLEVGSILVGTSNPARGKFFRAQVLNGIDGTVAFDANFETSITSLNQTSFTESSANAATVTINRSGSAYQSAGITAAGYLYPGATNTFTASATNFLDFGLSDSFTIIAAIRQWATPTNNGTYLSKYDSGGNGGYLISRQTTTTNNRFVIENPNNAIVATSIASASGDLSTVVGIRNVIADTITSQTNTTAGTPVTDTTTSDLTNFASLFVGRRGGTATYQDFEGYGFAVFRSVLTASQIRQIVNYFANREVYL